MRIQYFSDIHLEFGPFDAPATDADVIVAAGDIGVGSAGIEWLAGFDRPVVYVAGNHEYYGYEFNEVQATLRDLSKGTQVHFLDRDAVEIDGVRFVGCTMWTDFNAGNARLMAFARDSMNDYVQIGFEDRRLEPEDTLAFNRAAREFLAAELARAHDGPTVVVTHHAPLHASWQGEPSPLIHAYCNRLDGDFETWDAAFWFHGHIHFCRDYEVGGVRVLCNPRGYTGFQRVAGFDGGRTVELPVG